VYSNGSCRQRATCGAASVCLQAHINVPLLLLPLLLQVLELPLLLLLLLLLPALLQSALVYIPHL
jgi:hypothetical protein